MTPSLDWRISGPAHAAAVLTGLAIAAAAVTGHGELVALPLPALLWLTVALRVDRPATTTLTAIATPRRCAEGDVVEIRLVRPADGLTYRGEILSSRPADPADPVVVHADGTSWRLRLPGWGRQTVELMVHASTPGGALAAAIRVSVPVVVEPRGLPGTAALRSTVRRPSYGERPARVAGAGTEFLDVSAWTPGTPLRRVHWAATLRTGEIHVAGMAADRSQDVLIVVDAMAEVGPFGDTCVDRAARAAVALAHAHLRAGDRVGLAVFGSHLRWVVPGTGMRHLIRVVNCLLEQRGWPDLDRVATERVPAPVLLPGALTICLTPLLREESLRVVGDVRRRGHPTVVIDVLDHDPPARARRSDQQALRAWRLDRVALHRQLSRRGVVTVRWPTEVSLPAALSPLARRPLRAAAGGRR